MLVYTPATLLGPPDRRHVDLLPGTLRLVARGLVAGAFCWDETGMLKPGWQMLSYMLHVADCDIIGVVAAEVDEAGWLDAVAAMGGPVEAPWGSSVEGLARACSDTATTLRQRSATMRALRQGVHAPEDARAIIDLWGAVGQVQQRVRAHYRAALDPATSSETPRWLVANGVPNIAAARALLAAVPIDVAHPLRVADDAHLLACCESIATRII